MNRLLARALIGFALGFALVLLFGCASREPSRPDHGGWNHVPWIGGAPFPWIT